MKKDNRTKRLVLGILLPLIIASFLLTTWAVAQSYFIDGKNILRFDRELPILLGILKSAAGFIGVVLLFALYATFASGIQSILISFLMEYVINPKIENNLAVLFICGSLGLISGVFIYYVFPFGKIWFIPLGGVTGIIVGKILRDNYNRSPEIES